jgi:hypothetical protein
MTDGLLDTNVIIRFDEIDPDHLLDASAIATSAADQIELEQVLVWTTTNFPAPARSTSTPPVETVRAKSRSSRTADHSRTSIVSARRLICWSRSSSIGDRMRRGSGETPLGTCAIRANPTDGH